MRIAIGCIVVALATPAAASDAPSTKYWGFPVPSDPKSIWLMDTNTGSLSRCESIDLTTSPTCSPWAIPPGENAAYRYDPELQKLIPMNEAAKRRDAERSNSK